MGTKVALSAVDGRYRRATEKLRVNAESISPLDGTYSAQTANLREIFNEKGLARSRLVVEGEYLIYLSTKNMGVRPLTEFERRSIRGLYDLSDQDFQIIKDIELKGHGKIKATNHDVKSIEYYMQLKLEDTSLKDVLGKIHFGLTSEDTTSIAYALMLSDGLTNVIVPELEHLASRIGGGEEKGSTWSSLGKRIDKQIQQLKKMKILAKLNGAVGNYSALSVAFPEVPAADWLKFSTEFIDNFNAGREIPITANLITTQIESHDNRAEIFDTVKSINNMLLGFVRDTKPENDKTIVAKLEVANAMFDFFSVKLPVSRLQRDLSDSTVLRSLGNAFGNSYVAYEHLLNPIREEVLALPVPAENPEHKTTYNLQNIVVPQLKAVIDAIGEFGRTNGNIPILARTHGQPAIGTRFDKEFKVYQTRLDRQNGNLSYVLTSDQQDSDTYADLFDNLRRINTILIGFSQDMWRYISDDWLKLKVKEGEVGSSTMPQKVNPIDFENAEGNLGMSNALLRAFSTHVSTYGIDNEIESHFGEALAHTLIAYNSLLKGISKISVDEKKVVEVLNGHPEVIAEAIQTILRREGIPDAYEQLKALTRGRKITLEDFTSFTDQLTVPDLVKEQLRSLRPDNYLGIAKELAAYGNTN